MCNRFIMVLCVALCLGACDPETVMRELGRTSSGGLTDSRIAQGLKEALRVGTDHAVMCTGKRDGYFGNNLIKILLPESVQRLDQGLRLVGYGQKIDAFVLSMNRAAEQAAPKAKSIFIDAILAMTFEDARRILNGRETAATDFFKAKTSQQLYDAFRPVITSSMNRVGTIKQYNALLGRARQPDSLRAEGVRLATNQEIPDWTQYPRYSRVTGHSRRLGTATNRDVVHAHATPGILAPDCDGRLSVCRGHHTTRYWRRFPQSILVRFDVVIRA